ncbi:MAG: hypothetical protein M1825_005646 [Sarcosagium campestre]|nr:MAG: hypothetical protein M1825_005646 [Sarcosagium campestre]
MAGNEGGDDLGIGDLGLNGRNPYADEEFFPEVALGNFRISDDNIHRERDDTPPPFLDRESSDSSDDDRRLPVPRVRKQPDPNRMQVDDEPGVEEYEEVVVAVGELFIALDLTKKLRIVPIPTRAPVASPLARIDRLPNWRRAKIMRDVAAQDGNGDASNLKILWDLTSVDRLEDIEDIQPDVRSMIARGHEGFDMSGDYGFIAYLEENDADEMGNRRVDYSQSQEVLRARTLDDTYLLMLPNAKDPEPDAFGDKFRQLAATLDFRRLPLQKSDALVGYGWFILNTWHSVVKINNVEVRPNRLGGPLPGFAVIRLGAATVFWWNSPESQYVEYIPPLPVNSALLRNQPIEVEEVYHDVADRGQSGIL